MNETHREDPHAPLSYHGARRIVWLVFFVFIIWLILRALHKHNGNQTEAARALGLPLRTLVHKIQTYGIKKKFDR